MMTRKEELRLEQIKDYDFEKLSNPPLRLSEYDKGSQATLEELFPQVKSPYSSIRTIKDPVYLPDDYDYYTANVRKIRRK